MERREGRCGAEADRAAAPAQLVYMAARDHDIKRVGFLSANWPDRSEVEIITRKGSGVQTV